MIHTHTRKQARVHAHADADAHANAHANAHTYIHARTHVNARERTYSHANNTYVKSKRVWVKNIDRNCVFTQSDHEITWCKLPYGQESLTSREGGGGSGSVVVATVVWLSRKRAFIIVLRSELWNVRLKIVATSLVRLPRAQLGLQLAPNIWFIFATSRQKCVVTIPPIPACARR